MLVKPTPYDEASAFIASKPIVSQRVFAKLLPQLKGRAFVIAGIEAANILQNVRDTLATLPLGGDWEEIKATVLEQIDPYFIDPAADAETQDAQRRAANRRAELLIRTHGQQAYMAGLYGVANEQREMFPYWQYQSLGDGRVRPSHAALDGIVLPANHEFWKTHTPPWDWGCRCEFIPLTEFDVQEMRDQDKDKPLEKKRVIEGELLTKLENERTLWRPRNLATGEGDPVPYNVAAPSETGKEGAFSWHPDDLTLTPAQLKDRYEPEVWAQFESWAKTAPIAELKLTVWEWMSGSRIVESTAPTVLPAVAGETADELLKRIGLAGVEWKDTAATTILAALKKPGALSQSLAVSEVRGALQKTGFFSEAGIRSEMQNILDIVPPEIAAKLPKLTIEVDDGLNGAFGDYNPKTHILRLSKRAIKNAEKHGREPRETLWHEAMHWLHLHGPESYKTAIREHFRARTAGEEIVKLAPFTSRGKRDKWYCPYTGTIYLGHDDDSTEGEGLELPTRHFQLFAAPAKLAQVRNINAEFEETFKIMLSLFL